MDCEFRLKMAIFCDEVVVFGCAMPELTKRVRDSPALLRPLRNVDRVPLPGLAFIRREGLTPDREFRITDIPAEHDDDVLALVRIAGEEMADVVLERSDDW